MKETSPPLPEECPPNTLLTKDEMNLVEFPFAFPAHRHPKGKNVLRVTLAGKNSEGRPITREWIARGSQDLGLPLATDEEVLLGLFHLWQKEGFKERHVWFTQYSLFKLLGWHHKVQSYHRLLTSMRRLKGLAIESCQSFWNNKERCHVTDGFGLVDGYRLWTKESTSTDHPFLSRVTFSEFLHNSIQAGYIRSLDLGFYLALRFPLARKLYRFLDKRSYKKPIVEIGLMDLATRLALTDSAYPSKVKQHLKEPHEELIDRGFLEAVRYEERNGTPWVRYAVVPKSRRRLAPPPAKEKKLPFPEHPLVKELVSRGITHAVAVDLVENHGERRTAEQIEAFDFLAKQKSHQLSKNPAGYLRRAIETDFAMPTGFVSKADRDRKRQAQETTERQQAEAKAAEERAERERQDLLEQLWNSLVEADQVVITAEATSRLDPIALRGLAKETAAGPCHGLLRHYRDEILAQRFPNHPGRAGTEVPPTKRLIR